MDKQQGIAILTNIDKNIQLLLDEFISLRTEALVPLMNAFSSKNEFDRNFATGTFDILKDIQSNLASNGTFEDRSNLVQLVQTKDMLTDIQAQVTNIAHNPYLEDIKNSKLMNFVLKRKGTLKQTWSHKRNEAKQAFESMINSQNKARIFDDWIQTEVFLPKKYRAKTTESTPEDQKHLLHKLGFLKMKADVKSMQENAQKQSDKFDVVMDKMRDIIQNRESANVAEKMIELWDEDIANMKEKAIEESKKCKNTGKINLMQMRMMTKPKAYKMLNIRRRNQSQRNLVSRRLKSHTPHLTTKATVNTHTKSPHTNRFEITSTNKEATPT